MKIRDPPFPRRRESSSARTLDSLVTRLPDFTNKHSALSLPACPYLTIAGPLLFVLALLGLSCVQAAGQTASLSPAEFARLSSEAEAAREAGQLEQAVGLYKSALALNPAWTAGWWSLGTILYDENAYGRAADSFRRVTTLAPKDGTAWVMLGLCEFEMHRDSEALQHIGEGKRLGIIQDSQLRHVMLYHEGVLRRRAGALEGAQEDFDALCGDGVQNSAVLGEMGLAALRIRKESITDVDPASARIIMDVGKAACLAAKRNFDEAQQQFGAVVKAYPSYPNIHYAYGTLLLQLHDTRDAAEEFQQEIKNNPRTVMARLKIAAIEYRVDSAAGLPYAEEAVKLDPELPFGHYLLGLLLVDTKQYRQGIRELEIARPSFSAVPNLYYALGTAYSRTGQKQDAERAWAKFKLLSREAGQQGPLYYGQEPSAIAQGGPNR